MTLLDAMKKRESRKSNVEKLIDAAFKVFDENYSSCEGDEFIVDLLEGGFFYNGHDYRAYAEGLDLGECDAAAEFYSENEFISQMVNGIYYDAWITKDRDSGEVIVRTRRTYSDDEWQVADKSEYWIEDILDCPRWS